MSKNSKPIGTSYVQKVVSVKPKTLGHQLKQTNPKFHHLFRILQQNIPTTISNQTIYLVITLYVT
ncbi:hypothetical protein HanIR_Chr03g0147401 [Helianthus annuus]|nr:hypothetical protein HanIR_Chr03g0147401 [Helianthus annuus]